RAGHPAEPAARPQGAERRLDRRRQFLQLGQRGLLVMRHWIRRPRCRPVHLISITVLAVGLALAGCAKKATPVAALGGAAEAPPLGNNLVGEECRATAGHDALPDPNSPPPIDIVCGKGT